jgi:sugar transferase (PEP-CTERM/EpsH1 system associated)
MRILMISPYLPWPLYGGASVRTFNIIKNLSEKGHKITLLAGRQKDANDVSLRELCEEIYMYELPRHGRLLLLLRSVFSSQPYPALQFQNKHLDEKFTKLLQNEKFDLIWINFLFMANILFKTLTRNIPVILDQFEADELIWKRYIKNGNFFQKVFSYLNLKKIQILQKRVFGQINALICVSEAEAEFMKLRAPLNMKIWVAPNGVDADFFQDSSDIKKTASTILLSGSMCIVRNIDAAVWFGKTIFPKIKKVVPEAEFWIVGYNPDKKVLALNAIPGIIITGTVEDIRPYYKKAKVYVAPFRFGEGTRLKILEAMATGLPIVSTEGGCQGIDVIDGQHMFVANSEEDFSNRVIELLRNPQLSQKLTNAGRMLVEQKYNWEAIVNNIDKQIKGLQ